MRIRRGHVIATAAALAVAAAGVVWAQGTAPQAGTGTLAALTEEVRQLRLTVQNSAATQTQTQAMAVYLSAQQSRMTQLAGRLDKVQNDLRARVTANQQLSARLTEAQAQLGTTTDQAARNELTAMVKMFKEENDRATNEEMQLRNRESELIAALQAEDARWQDLVARLEALVKR